MDFGDVYLTFASLVVSGMCIYFAVALILSAFFWPLLFLARMLRRRGM